MRFDPINIFSITTLKMAVQKHYPTFTTKGIYKIVNCGEAQL
jgi:hypothetical protein